LRDMAHALYGSELDDDLVKARKHLRQYVKCLMESESNATAVALITRFSIQCCDESFLIKLIESNQLDIAEECATFMGKEMISLIIQKFLDMKMLKSANKLVKEHDLTEEFPDVSYLYKESLVKKLAEKGCWDIAEARAKKEKKLVEYLVMCIHIITISVLLYFTKMADSYGQGVECICPCILFCWMK